MENNLDKIAKDLYGKIKTRFTNIKMGDANAEVLSKKSDIPNARFFEFEYEENDNVLGTIAITLDEEDGIVLQLSGELNIAKSSHSLNQFIKSFRQFAKTRMLNFDVQNIGKSNLDKRDYQFQAKPKELQIMESKMFGTNRISYQNLGETRLIVKHNQAIDPAISGSRSMHIQSIFIENTEGERFKYPFKHLNGARALAEHIGNGGTPYDGIGKHITGLSEELTQLRKFKNYVNRQPQLAESVGSITEKVMERIEEVKKQINMLQRPSYYKEFSESFQEREQQAIPEEILNDWVDRLTIRTFNEELSNVFPFLYNIIDETALPIKELGVDDLLDETTTIDSSVNKKTSVNTPEKYIEQFLENIVNEDKDELFSPNPGSQNRAIEKFNQILAVELSGGPAGVVALKGIIDDPLLINKVQVLHTDEEIRKEIKDYILDKKPELIPLLPELDNLNPTPIGGETPTPETPAEPAAPAATPTAPPAPTPAIAPEPAAVEPPVAPEQVPPAPAAPIAEGTSKKAKIKAKFIKLKEAGATLSTEFAEGMTVLDAIKECGLEPSECGFDDEEQPETEEDGVSQLLKVVSGFWNKEKRNFTIGGARAKIKVVKAFKDGECQNASDEDVKKVLSMIDKMDPSDQTNSEPDMEINVDNRENDLLRNVQIMQEQPYMENEINMIKRNAGLLK